MTRKTSFGDNWNNDKLERSKEAKFLTDYLIGKKERPLNNFNNGSFVLNVNAEWGFGKTYFLKNWADDLASQSHPTVYFDAWENDFSKDPLIAFIASINEQLKPYFSKSPKAQKRLETWQESGKKLVKTSLPILLGVLAKKASGMSWDELSGLFEDEREETPSESNEGNSQDGKKELQKAVSTVVSKAATQMLASHNSTLKTIREFKRNLALLTEKIDELKSIKTPIFIFVDELDRCRPNYAIELLENIKHLFGVKGVFFIVATASEQLCHSIKSIYGHEFDSSSYLKRFFDQTYTMQEPDRFSFAKYLFEQYGLTGRKNLFSPINKSECVSGDENIDAFAIISNYINSGLRDMMQNCIILDAISITDRTDSHKYHIFYLVFLISLKEKNKKIYHDHINNHNVNFEDIRKLYNSKYTFKTSQQTDNFHYHTKPLLFEVYRLIDHYFQIAHVDYEGISKSSTTITALLAVNEQLQRESPHSWPSGTKPKHKLLTYPALIEQAGRIK
ncbi:MAG: KAP family P-loop NTPase fold protein [Desulfobulbia bacterium]